MCHVGFDEITDTFTVVFFSRIYTNTCCRNKKDKIATLKCRICSEEYQGRIHCTFVCVLSSDDVPLSVDLLESSHILKPQTDLSEPIDVYNEWINELNEERDSGSEDSDSD